MPKASASRWQKWDLNWAPGRRCEALPAIPHLTGRLTNLWDTWASVSSPLVSPQMYAMKSSLENMDAMELDFRMRLAEVQRQYKEKQRELVKLQRRRESE